jgi:hypothetical protein
MPEPTEILALISTPIGRLTLTAWAVNAGVRLLKEDTRLFPTVKAEHRRTLAFALGLVAGVLQAVATGASWRDAAIVTLGAPLLAILGHHGVVDVARGGRDLPIPAWLRAGQPVTGTTKRIVGGLLIFLLTGCSSLRGVPVLSTADAIGRGAAQVFGWCDERGISPEKVDAGRKAIADRDYAAAVALASELVAASRKAGDPIPEDVEVVLRLAEGAMAAQAVADGMRALSGKP